MELTQYLIVNSSLGMNKGKIAAQCAHASVSVLAKVDRDVLEEWMANGMKKIVLKIASTEELLALFEKAKRNHPCALITDAGKTQIAPGSKTVFACGPIAETEGEKLFKDLKLL